VGWDTYDELNISSVTGGNNFGWPFWEGPIAPPLSPFDQDSYAGPLPYIPFDETSLTVAISHNPALLAHDPPDLATDVQSASSITGGVQYDWKDYKPLNVEPPYSEVMDGKYLFADWGMHTLYTAELGPDHQIESIQLAADGLILPSEAGEGIVELALDPVKGRIFASTFWRVWVLEYNPAGAPPVARLVADANSGDVPLDVSFDASASSNPDGGAIDSYTWFVDDHVLESTTAPTYHYGFDEDRNYDFGVGVTNSYNLTSTTTLKIYAGNKPPKARITSPDRFTKYPPDGTAVDVGYTGEASDDDGTVELIKWNLAVGHNLHRHEIDEREGDLSGTFNLRASEDANSWFIIELTVTDNRGQSATDRVDVYEEGEGPLRIAWMLH
jgi:cytochrome c